MQHHIPENSIFHIQSRQNLNSEFRRYYTATLCVTLKCEYTLTCSGVLSADSAVNPTMSLK
jgi:hypothetical protein